MASPNQRARHGLAPTGKPRAATRYELALLYCAAIWGSTFYIVKDAVGELHPLTLIGWRFTLAGLLLLPIVYFRRGASLRAPRHKFVQRGAGTGTRPFER